MSQIIKEVLTYFLFLIFLLLVAYGNRDPYAYLLRKNLHDTFVDLDETGVDLADVSIWKLFLLVIQSTPDNSNLQGKSKKGSSYREFELSRVRGK